MHRERKPVFLLTLLLIMLAGSMVSRVVLSLSTAWFLVAACVHPDFFKQVKQTFTHPLTAGITLLFFIPLISGAWSTDTQTWASIVAGKSLFLLMPIAFWRLNNVNERQWKLFAYYVLVILFIATLWSIVAYLPDSKNINENYLKAKTMPVPMYGDHVRFSWLICIGLITSLLLFSKTALLKHKLLLLLTAVWFIVYLHLLAARTGLVAAYIFTFIFLLYHLTNYPRRKFYWAIAGVVLVVISVAWLSFPTLQNRVRFMKYNFLFIKDDKYLPGGNDGNRVLSLKAGWSILKQYPFGTGAGDVNNDVSTWYEENINGIKDEDKIFPANEWLIHGDMAGWPAVLLFTIAMIIPFLIKKIYNRLYWFGLSLVSIFICMTDSSLEVQLGIFIYTFTTLWWWLWCKAQKE